MHILNQYQTINHLIKPRLFLILTILLVLVFLIHCVYGDCQTSKFHFIIQKYYAKKYLPSFLLIGKSSKFNSVDVPELFNGCWRTWYSNGQIESKCNFLNGESVGKSEWWYLNGHKESSAVYNFNLRNGRFTFWYLNGNELSTSLWVNGKPHGKSIEWFEDGNKRRERVFNNSVLVLNISWNKDGTLNKKEYYDTKGNLKKREFFEKGKLVKTELEE